MPTTLRIALLAGLLALLSNVAVVGFIYWRTHDESLSTVRRQVVEQGKVVSDMYRVGGQAALDDAVEDAITYGDPQVVAALLDRSGRQVIGNLAVVPTEGGKLQEGYRSALLRLKNQSTPRDAASDARHLWLRLSSWS